MNNGEAKRFEGESRRSNKKETRGWNREDQRSKIKGIFIKHPIRVIPKMPICLSMFHNYFNPVKKQYNKILIFFQQLVSKHWL